jgi:hypothetical protein
MKFLLLLVFCACFAVSSDAADSSTDETPDRTVAECQSKTCFAFFFLFFFFFSFFSFSFLFNRFLSELTNLLDFSHAQGGQLKDLVVRACIKFDWLGKLKPLFFPSFSSSSSLSRAAAEYNSNRRGYRQWIRKEQFEIGLEDVLGRGPLRDCFARFLRGQYNGETLAFVLDVERFETLDPGARKRLGCRIWRLYFSREAATPVALSGAVRKELKAGLAYLCRQHHRDTLNDHPLPMLIFEGAVTEATRELRDYLGSFMSSDYYQQCPLHGSMNRDLKSYNLLREKYCKAEGRAYVLGDEERKRRTMEALRHSVWKECETDPNVDLNHI